MTERKIVNNGNPRGSVYVSEVRRSAEQVLAAVAELREGHEPRFPKPDDLEILAQDYLAITANEQGLSKESMTTKPQRLTIPDPFPESIGLSSLTLWVPEDFRGDAEVIWWYAGKTEDKDKYRLTCRATALLQGLLYDVRGARRTADEDLPALDKLTARVVALAIHEFYKQRIKQAAQLEAAYQWQSYAP